MPRRALLYTVLALVLAALALESPLAAGLAALAFLALRRAAARRRRGAVRRVLLLVGAGTTLAGVVVALAVPVYRSRPEPLLLPVASGGSAPLLYTHPGAPGSARFEALGFVVADDDGATQAVDANVAQVSTLAATGLSLASAPGSLSVLTGNDAPQRAHLNGARSLLVLSNYATDGFDGGRAEKVLRSANARRRLVSAVSAAVAKADADGVVLDLEQLPASVRSSLVTFTGQLHRTLGGKRLVVAVPASDDPTDPALVPFDLAGLSHVADQVMVMAYDQHESSSGPGPVAGLDWVRRSMAIAGSFVPARQLLLGLPSYGYVWPAGGAPTDITVAQGRALSLRPRARTAFDPAAGEVHVQLPDGTQAWYDDGRSVRAHVQLARELHLAGVGIWRLGGGDTLTPYQLAGPVLRYPAETVPGRTLERVKATGLVALTFDDGPDPTWTPRILAVLRKYDVPATFFVIGDQAQSHQGLVREEIADGDVVGNHTYSHLDVSTLPAWRAKAEIEGGALVVEGITGRRPLLFRSPYGAGELTNSGGADKDALSVSMGFHAVNWTADTLDWKRPGVVNIIKAADEQASARTIVLMHDGGGNRSETLLALPKIIQDLRDRGYQFTTVDAFDGSITSPYAVRTGAASRLRGLAVVAGFRLDMALRKLVLALLVLLAAIAGLRYLVSVPLALVHRRRERRHLAPLLQPSRPLSVSVLVPAHDEQTLLDRALESLLALDPPATEIIVIDDGSTDGTAAVARRYPVTLLQQSQSGKAAALNAGIARATGEVVVALDADTIVAPDFLQTLLPHFQDPAVGAVAGNVKVGNRTRLLPRLQSLEYIISLNLDRRAQAQMGTVTVVPGAAGAFRRSALTQAGGYPQDTMVEDADLTMRLLRDGWRVRYEPTAVAWTEAPQTVRDVVRQRRRWSYGTVQVAAKHRDAVLQKGSGRAGTVAMPWMVLSQVVVPALGPLVDLYLVYLWLVGNHLQAVVMLGLALGLDLVVATVAVLLDREDARQLVFVPLLRLVWRPLQLWAAIGSLARWLSGSSQQWGALRRYRSVRLPRPATT